MKKIIKLVIAIIFIVSISGCHKDDNLKFKEDYESLNGVKTSYNIVHRTITIDKNNPFVYSNLKEINKMIEKKKTFIVYFGANWCPWCRSMLPTAIKEANIYNIDKIYYVNVREGEDEDNDIRDIYSIDDNGKTYLSHKGVKEYSKFLEYAGNVLKEYDSHGVVVKGVKRVGAPNFILFKNGVAVKMEEGISSKMTNPTVDITEEMIKDMTKIFDNLYKEYLN
jgi:thiol-disulfide isomerase/thioredoxin